MQNKSKVWNPWSGLKNGREVAAVSAEPNDTKAELNHLVTI